MDQLERLVAIMDRLRSPGGCPWDAKQTHESLAEYLLEETHETLAAIESGTESDLVEELGDILLQVVFHARIGQEASQPWSLAEVAEGISDKLVRRHPHVFEGDGGSPASATEGAGSEESWAQAKAREKDRESVLDGIPRTLPGLAQAQKTLRRARQLGLPLDGWSAGAPGRQSGAAESGAAESAQADSTEVESAGSEVDEAGLREALMSLVFAAEAAGLDAEAAMRHEIETLRSAIKREESSRSPDSSG